VLVTASQAPQSLFDPILALNREAFQAGDYNTAYYLLAAALHAAQGEETGRQLYHVKTIAANQLTWIDIEWPEYEHSTKSAATRGQSSIFRLLAQQAHAKLLLYQQEERRRHGRLGRWLEPRSPSA
jgi:hypothetical protein